MSIPGLTLFVMFYVVSQYFYTIIETKHLNDKPFRVTKTIYALYSITIIYTRIWTKRTGKVLMQAQNKMPEEDCRKIK